MDHPFQKRRTSLAKAPNGVDVSVKNDTVDMLKGTKKSMSEVNYTQAAYGSKNRCSECEFYLKPQESKSPCAKVVGSILADATCDLFVKRSAKSSDSEQTIEITVKLN